MASFSTGTLSCAATLIIGFMCIDTACYAFNYQPDRKIGINKYPGDNRILGNIERNRRSSDVGGDVTVSDQSVSELVCNNDRTPCVCYGCDVIDNSMSLCCRDEFNETSDHAVTITLLDTPIDFYNNNFEIIFKTVVTNITWRFCSLHNTKCNLSEPIHANISLDLQIIELRSINNNLDISFIEYTSNRPPESDTTRSKQEINQSINRSSVIPQDVLYEACLNMSNVISQGLNKNITVSRAWWTVPAIPVNSIDLVAAIILGILGGLFLMVCFISAVKACRDRKAIKRRIALRRELKKNAIKVLHEYSSLNNQAERNGKIGRNVRNGQVNHGLDITDETTQVVEVTVHKEYTAQNTPQKGQPMEESAADKSPRSLKELAREISKSEIVIPNGNVVPEDEHGDHIPVMNGNHNTVHQNGNHVNGNGVVCCGNGTATKGNGIHSNPKHNINNTHTDSESCNGLPSSPLASDSTSTFPRVKNGIGRGLGYRHSYQGAEITRFHEKQVINKFKQFRKVKSDNTLIKANGVKKELGKRLSDKNANSIEESEQIPEGAFDDVTIQ